MHSFIHGDKIPFSQNNTHGEDKAMNLSSVTKLLLREILYLTTDTTLITEDNFSSFGDFSKERKIPPNIENVSLALSKVKLIFLIFFLKVNLKTSYS